MKPTCFLSKATSVPGTYHSQFSSTIDPLNLLVESKSLPVELNNSTSELHVLSKRKQSLQSYSTGQK